MKLDNPTSKKEAIKRRSKACPNFSIRKAIRENVARAARLRLSLAQAWLAGAFDALLRPTGRNILIVNKNIIIAALICTNFITLLALVCVLIWSASPRSVVVTPAQQNEARNDTDNGPQEFTFNKPGHFAGSGAPIISNRTISITATFDPQQEKDGVIVAQGGAGHGYALYVQDGELWFAVRRFTVLTAVSGGSVSAGRHTAIATLSKTGELSLSRDGNAPATTRAAGLLGAQPTDGLDIGADRGAPVGPYQTPNAFGGTIESINLKTAP